MWHLSFCNVFLQAFYHFLSRPNKAKSLSTLHHSANVVIPFSFLFVQYVNQKVYETSVSYLYVNFIDLEIKPRILTNLLDFNFERFISLSPNIPIILSCTAAFAMNGT